MKNRNEKMRYAAAAFGRGIRVMAAFDVARARTRCEELRTSMRTAREELAEHVQAGTGTDAQLTRLRDQIARDAQEYSDLNGALTLEEDRQRSRVAAAFNQRMGRVSAEARGALFRSMITGAEIPAQILNTVSAPITIGANPGNGLLPVNVSDELIGDIYDDGGFLNAITVTNIPGLRLPKATTTVTATDAALADGADATEHEMVADVLLFGRYPGRDVIVVPTAVLEGTHTQLDAYLSGKLTEAHRERLYRRVFSTTAAGDYAHMSVYNAAVGVQSVAAGTLYEGICAALAALPVAARRVAKVALTPAAYYGMVKDLAAGAQALFGTPSASVLGFAVELCDNAVKPVVGDLKTIHVNYDASLKLESDSNVRTGVTDVVISADYDIQIEDAGRLRIVEVGDQGSEGGNQGSEGGNQGSEGDDQGSEGDA